jgi:Restriction endonuclease
MTGAGETFIALAVFGAALGAAYGWFSDKSKKLREDEFNRGLRTQLEAEKSAFDRQVLQRERGLNNREKFIVDLRKNFDAGFLQGRRWLASFVADADRIVDEAIADQLRYRPRAARKAAEEVSIARADRRAYKERATFLEFHLQSLKEYFPFLEEYEDVILDEAVPLATGASNRDLLEESDPVLRYLEKADYDRLSPGERNQLALDRYLSGRLSASEIGRLYERYLGYMHERDGWHVEYHGIVEGHQDLGRDLICAKDGHVKIVQAKCWSKEKTIHEKHIFQLFGTTQLYLMDRCTNDMFAPTVSAFFVTTTSLSPVARKAAEWLKIEVREQEALSKTFPMIKCNVNQSTNDEIYHLPFDQQYDHTRIEPERGEMYVTTVGEAESKGFRRAFRFSGPYL